MPPHLGQRIQRPEAVYKAHRFHNTYPTVYPSVRFSVFPSGLTCQGRNYVPLYSSPLPHANVLVPPTAAETDDAGTRGRLPSTLGTLPATFWEAQVQETHIPGPQP